MFRMLRRLDDYAFVDWLVNMGALNIILIPRRNMLLVWATEPIKHRRIESCKKVKNKLYICRARLSMSFS